MREPKRVFTYLVIHTAFRVVHLQSQNNHKRLHPQSSHDALHQQRCHNALQPQRVPNMTRKLSTTVSKTLKVRLATTKTKTGYKAQNLTKKSITVIPTHHNDLERSQTFRRITTTTKNAYLRLRTSCGCRWQARRHRPEPHATLVGINSNSLAREGIPSSLGSYCPVGLPVSTNFCILLTLTNTSCLHYLCLHSVNFS